MNQEMRQRIYLLVKRILILYIQCCTPLEEYRMKTKYSFFYVLFFLKISSVCASTFIISPLYAATLIYTNSILKKALNPWSLLGSLKFETFHSSKLIETIQDIEQGITWVCRLTMLPIPTVVQVLLKKLDLLSGPNIELVDQLRPYPSSLPYIIIGLPISKSLSSWVAKNQHNAVSSIWCSIYTVWFIRQLGYSDSISSMVINRLTGATAEKRNVYLRSRQTLVQSKVESVLARINLDALVGRF